MERNPGSVELPLEPVVRGVINGSRGDSRSVRRGLQLLVELVLAKRKLSVKPRDLVLVLGFDPEDPALSVLGKTLAALERAGLAVRHNSSRPRRYTLRPKQLWKRFIEIELAQGMKFQCTTDSSTCSLIGLCPLWRIAGWKHAT